MEFVNRLGGGHYGSLKSECCVRGHQVVVDGFRHPDDIHAHIVKFMSDFQRAVPADDDQGIKSQLLV